MKILKWILLIIAVIFTIWLFIDTGIENIYIELKKLGWYIILFFIPYLGTYIFDTLGWKYSFTNFPNISFFNLFKIRLAGESINYTTPTAYIGGEPIKALILNKKINYPLTHGIASIIIAKFLMTVAEVIFIIIGLELGIASLGRHNLLRLSSIGMLIFGLSLIFFLFLQKKGLGKIFISFFHKIKFINNFFQNKEEKIKEFDKVLSNYYNNKKKVFLSIFYFFIAWCIGALEIYVILKLHGFKNINPYEILAMESMFVAIKGLGFIVPGSVGIQEGGTVGVFILFGFSKSIGLTFSILRRIREILWIIIGVIFLYKEWNKKEEILKKNNEKRVINLI